MTDRRARMVFLGSGAFAVPALRATLVHPDVELVGVVTAPPRPAGRRGQSRSTPFAGAAPAGVPLLTPPRLREPAAIAGVLDLRPELVVLADYGQIVPAPLLGLPHGALNLHPSLLPRHRGATPIPAAILAGDTLTGVTLMRMDEGLDTGPIIAHTRWALDGTEIAPDLEALLADEAAALLSASLGPWLRGELPARPQSEHGATVTRRLRRADGRLDPGRPAVELERQVRAYQPWPGTFVETGEGRVAVLQAGLEVPAAEVVPPGTLTPDGLVTADGILALHEVRPAGGRAMPWAAYLRGHPGVVGSSVT